MDPEDGLSVDDGSQITDNNISSFESSTEVVEASIVNEEPMLHHPLDYQKLGHLLLDKASLESAFDKEADKIYNHNSLIGRSFAKLSSAKKRRLTRKIGRFEDALSMYHFQRDPVPGNLVLTFDTYPSPWNFHVSQCYLGKKGIRELKNVSYGSSGKQFITLEDLDPRKVVCVLSLGARLVASDLREHITSGMLSMSVPMIPVQVDDGRNISFGMAHYEGHKEFKFRGCEYDYRDMDTGNLLVHRLFPVLDVLEGPMGYR